MADKLERERGQSMLAAMYLRKSRAEEKEPITETLARHRDTLRQFAQANGIIIEAIYEEVVSGDSLFSRPAMMKFINEISRFDAVLCMDIDRLGRGNMKEQGIILETLKEYDVKIVTPRKVYDLNNELDETYGEFQAFMARQELKLIKGRMQRGIRRSAEEGYHMGPPPYGYAYKKFGKKSILEILPEEAEIVKLIYREYLGGSGVNKIAGLLNEMGIPPRKASKWFPVSIRRILCNDVYSGQATYGKLMKSKMPGIKKTFRPPEQRISVQGLHERIISPDDYTKVMMIMEKKYRPPMPDYNSVRNPMAGLIKCQVCGHALNIFHSKGRVYLLCKTKGCCRMSNMDYIEEAVLEELQKHLIILKTAVVDKPIVSDSQTIRQGMKKELGKLTAQKEKLHDLLEQGVYTINVFNERMRSLMQRIKTIENASEREIAIVSYETVAMIPQMQNLLDVYKNFTAKERNELMKLLVYRIYYYKDRNAAPKDFKVTIELVAT